MNNHVHFRENSLGKWTPRSILFDCESDDVDSVLASDIGSILEANQSICGHESAVYHSRSHYTIGKELIDMDALRRESEQCDQVEDFLIFSSQYGGTGSGFTSLIMERMEVEFGRKTTIVNFSVVPSESNQSQEVVSMYNNVLAMGDKGDQGAIDIFVDNPQLYKVLSQNNTSQGDEETVTQARINELIAEKALLLTAGRRFGGNSCRNF